MRYGNRAFATTATLVATLAATPAVLAQSFPAKPVRMVTEFVAGSGGDALLRVFAAGLSANLGQPIVIENRAGGGGLVAAEAVARSAPDGYTLLGASPNVPVVRMHMAKVHTFDAFRELTPITDIGEPIIVIIAHPTVQANNLKELIALAKKEPGKLSYASSGIGSTHHLSGEQIKILTGVNIVHVPYKALAEATRDVVSNVIPLAFNLAGPIAPLVKAGKLKVLAVNNAKRAPQWPEVTTTAEEIQGYELPPSGTGLYGPGNMPADILKRIHADTIKALNDPEVKAKINAAGFETLGNTPEDYTAMLKRQMALVGRVVKSAGIQPTE
jgi:tripartite-type tricarboxylate transporter receptor subunit TctC